MLPSLFDIDIQMYAVPPKILGFKNKKSLLAHYLKHGKGVQAKSPEEYLEQANIIRKKGLTLPAKKGRVRMFDPNTGEHIIIDPNLNKIVTYYLRKAMLTSKKV